MHLRNGHKETILSPVESRQYINKGLNNAKPKQKENQNCLVCCLSYRIITGSSLNYCTFPIFLNQQFHVSVQDPGDFAKHFSDIHQLIMCPCVEDRLIIIMSFLDTFAHYNTFIHIPQGCTCRFYSGYCKC